MAKDIWISENWMKDPEIAKQGRRTGLRLRFDRDVMLGHNKETIGDGYIFGCKANVLIVRASFFQVRIHIDGFAWFRLFNTIIQPVEYYVFTG